MDESLNILISAAVDRAEYSATAQQAAAEGAKQFEQTKIEQTVTLKPDVAALEQKVQSLQKEAKDLAQVYGVAEKEVVDLTEALKQADPALAFRLLNKDAKSAREELSALNREMDEFARSGRTTQRAENKLQRLYTPKTEAQFETQKTRILEGLRARDLIASQVQSGDLTDEKEVHRISGKIREDIVKAKQQLVSTLKNGEKDLDEAVKLIEEIYAASSLEERRSRGVPEEARRYIEALERKDEAWQKLNAQTANTSAVPVASVGKRGRRTATPGGGATTPPVPPAIPPGAAAAGGGEEPRDPLRLRVDLDYLMEQIRSILDGPPGRAGFWPLRVQIDEVELAQSVSRALLAATRNAPLVPAVAAPGAGATARGTTAPIAAAPAYAAAAAAVPEMAGVAGAALGSSLASSNVIDDDVKKILKDADTLLASLQAGRKRGKTTRLAGREFRAQVRDARDAMRYRVQDAFADVHPARQSLQVDRLAPALSPQVGVMREYFNESIPEKDRQNVIGAARQARREFVNGITREIEVTRAAIRKAMEARKPDQSVVTALEARLAGQRELRRQVATRYGTPIFREERRERERPLPEVSRDEIRLANSALERERRQDLDQRRIDVMVRRRVERASHQYRSMVRTPFISGDFTGQSSFFSRLAPDLTEPFGELRRRLDTGTRLRKTPTPDVRGLVAKGAEIAAEINNALINRIAREQDEIKRAALEELRRQTLTAYGVPLRDLNRRMNGPGGSGPPDDPRVGAGMRWGGFKGLFRNALAFGGFGVASYMVSTEIRETMRQYMQFQQEIAGIQGVLKSKSPLEAQLIGSGVADAAQKYGFNLIEAARAARVLAQSGIEAKDVVKELNTTMAAARGMGMTLEQVEELQVAVRSVTAETDRYNKSINYSTAVLDKVSAVEARYAVESQDLAAAIKLLSPFIDNFAEGMTSVGDSFDFTIAMATVMVEKLRITGTQAANIIKLTLSRITRPEILNNLQENFGVKLKNELTGDFLPLDAMLKELGQKYQALSGTQRKAFVTELSGGRNLPAVTALLENYGRVFTIAAQSHASYGDTATRAAIGTDTLYTSAEKLRTSLTLFVNTAMEATGASKLLKGSIDLLSGGFNLLSGAGALGGVVGTLGTMLTIFLAWRGASSAVGLFATMSDSLTGMIMGLGRAGGVVGVLGRIAGFLGPTGIIVAGLTAILGLLGGVAIFWKRSREEAEKYIVAAKDIKDLKLDESPQYKNLQQFLETGGPKNTSAGLGNVDQATRRVVGLFEPETLAKTFGPKLASEIRAFAQMTDKEFERVLEKEPERLKSFQKEFVKAFAETLPESVRVGFEKMKLAEQVDYALKAVGGTANLVSMQIESAVRDLNAAVDAMVNDTIAKLEKMRTEKFNLNPFATNAFDVIKLRETERRSGFEVENELVRRVKGSGLPVAQALLSDKRIEKIYRDEILTDDRVESIRTGREKTSIAVEFDKLTERLSASKEGQILMETAKLLYTARSADTEEEDRKRAWNALARLDRQFPESFGRLLNPQEQLIVRNVQRQDKSAETRDQLIRERASGGRNETPRQLLQGATRGLAGSVVQPGFVTGLDEGANRAHDAVTRLKDALLDFTLDALDAMRKIQSEARFSAQYGTGFDRGQALVGFGKNLFGQVEDFDFRAIRRVVELQKESENLESVSRRTPEGKRRKELDVRREQIALEMQQAREDIENFVNTRLPEIFGQSKEGQVAYSEFRRLWSNLMEEGTGPNTLKAKDAFLALVDQSVKLGRQQIDQEERLNQTFQFRRDLLQQMQRLDETTLPVNAMTLKQSQLRQDYARRAFLLRREELLAQKELTKTDKEAVQREIDALDRAYQMNQLYERRIAHAEAVRALDQQTMSNLEGMFSGVRRLAEDTSIWQGLFEPEDGAWESTQEKHKQRMRVLGQIAAQTVAPFFSTIYSRVTENIYQGLIRSLMNSPLLRNIAGMGEFVLSDEERGARLYKDSILSASEQSADLIYSAITRGWADALAQTSTGESLAPSSTVGLTGGSILPTVQRAVSIPLSQFGRGQTSHLAENVIRPTLSLVQDPVRDAIRKANSKPLTPADATKDAPPAGWTPPQGFFERRWEQATDGLNTLGKVAEGFDRGLGAGALRLPGQIAQGVANLARVEVPEGPLGRLATRVEAGQQGDEFSRLGVKVGNVAALGAATALPALGTANLLSRAPFLGRFWATEAATMPGTLASSADRSTSLSGSADPRRRTMNDLALGYGLSMGGATLGLLANPTTRSSLLMGMRGLNSETAALRYEGIFYDPLSIGASKSAAEEAAIRSAQPGGIPTGGRPTNFYDPLTGVEERARAARAAMRVLPPTPPVAAQANVPPVDIPALPEQWAILSGGTRSTELAAELDRLGYKRTSVVSNYEDSKKFGELLSGTGFLVPDLPENLAMALSLRYQQPYALTPRGLHSVFDNTLIPSRGLRAADEQAYTRLPSGEEFKLDLDYRNANVLAPKGQSGEGYWKQLLSGQIPMMFARQRVRPMLDLVTNPKVQQAAQPPQDPELEKELTWARRNAEDVFGKGHPRVERAVRDARERFLARRVNERTAMTRMEALVRSPMADSLQALAGKPQAYGVLEGLWNPYTGKPEGSTVLGSLSYKSDKPTGDPARNEQLELDPHLLLAGKRGPGKRDAQGKLNIDWTYAHEMGHLYEQTNVKGATAAFNYAMAGYSRRKEGEPVPKDWYSRQDKGGGEHFAQAFANAFDSLRQMQQIPKEQWEKFMTERESDIPGTRAVMGSLLTHPLYKDHPAKERYQAGFLDRFLIDAGRHRQATGAGVVTTKRSIADENFYLLDRPRIGKYEFPEIADTTKAQLAPLPIDLAKHQEALKQQTIKARMGVQDSIDASVYQVMKRYQAQERLRRGVGIGMVGGNIAGTLAGRGGPNAQLGAQIGSTTGGIIGGLAPVAAAFGPFAPFAAAGLGIAGGLLGGLLGGRSDKKKEDVNNPVIRGLDAIERAQRDTIRTIEVQTDSLLKPESRLLNLPSTFNVPQYAPGIGPGGNGGSTFVDQRTVYDNRTFQIDGGNVNEIRKIIREEVGEQLGSDRKNRSWSK